MRFVFVFFFFWLDRCCMSVVCVAAVVACRSGCCVLQRVYSRPLVAVDRGDARFLSEAIIPWRNSYVVAISRSKLANSYLQSTNSFSSIVRLEKFAVPKEKRPLSPHVRVRVRLRVRVRVAPQRPTANYAARNNCAWFENSLPNNFPLKFTI